MFELGLAFKLWNPSELGTVTAWYNENGQGETTGFFSTWADQSGNGYTATLAGTLNARVEALHQINGMNAAFGKGLSNSSNGFTTAYTPSGDDVYIVARVRRDFQTYEGGASSIRPFVSFGDNNLSIGTARGNTSADQAVRVWDGTTVTSSASDSWAIGEFCTIILQFKKNSSLEVWKDGSSDSARILNLAAANVTLGSLNLCGQLGSTGRTFPGYMCELIIGEGVLTEQERSSLVNYMNRWDSGRTATVVYGWTGASELNADTAANQGVAAGDGFIFATGDGVLGDINHIFWYEDATYTEKGTYDTGTDNGGAHAQVNGLYYDSVNSKLYSGANNYPTTPDLGWIYEYDFDPAANSGSGSLTLNSVHPVSEGWCEGCHRFSDGTFLVCHNELNHLDLYNSSWVLQKEIDLTPTHDNGDFLWQGLTVQDDVVYASGHNGGTYPWCVGYLYENGELYEAQPYLQTPLTFCHQGIFNEGSTWLFARRTNNNVNPPNGIVRATPLTAVMDIG